MTFIYYIFFCDYFNRVDKMDFLRVQDSNQSSILDVNPFLSVSMQREYKFKLNLSAFS